MISQAEIKLIRQLSQKKFRESLNLFTIEGEKLFAEAQNSDYELSKVFWKKDIGEENMKKISSLASPSPVLAVVKNKYSSLKNPTQNGLYLALDSIKDPGNFGTIIRIAHWFGVDAVYASKDCVELYNPKTLQATMGSIFHVQIFYVDLSSFLNEFKNNLPIISTSLDGEDIYKSSLPERGFIVLGNESKGVSDVIKNISSINIRIPSYSNSIKAPDSLNVAIASSIILSEIKRSFV